MKPQYIIAIHQPFTPSRMFKVYGIEVAWNAYIAAKEFGELVGADNVMLIDGETGEIISDVFDD